MQYIDNMLLVNKVGEESVENHVKQKESVENHVKEEEERELKKKH